MQPLWKQAFDRVEQAAGPALASFTASDQFAEIMKVSLKISNDMVKQSEALSRQWLHALNLPAAGDVAYLKGQVGSLEAEVRSLRRTIEASTTAAATSPALTASTRAPAKSRTAKRATAQKTAAKKPAAKKTAAKKPAAKKPAAKKTAVKKAGSTR